MKYRKASLSDFANLGLNDNNTTKQDRALNHPERAALHDNAESRRRSFSPFEYGYDTTETISTLTRPLGGFSHLVCPHDKTRCPVCDCRVFHYDTLVIAVDGVCPNNGKANNLVFSAAGVYVGASSLAAKYNGTYTLVDEGATNQKAELQAAIKGLETYWKIEPSDLCSCEIKTLIIKTDSKYVHDGITDWIQKWKDNNWVRAAGRPVLNKGYWQALDAEIEAIEAIEATGTRVLFW